MKTFYNFIKFNFLLLGFDVDGKYSSNPRMSIVLKLWKILNPILMIIGSVQLLTFFLLLSKESSAVEVTMITFGSLFAVNSFAGYLTVVATSKSSMNLIRNIEKIYTKITENERTIEDEETVKSAYSIGLKFFAIITGSVLMNLVTSLIKVFMAMVTDSDPGNLSTMHLWFPAFLGDVWIFVAVYDPFIMMLYCLSNLFVSELVFITSAYLAASFDRLGDKLKEVIDGTENRAFLETKKKFSECVDFHSELIELADDSNKFYGPYNLIFLVLISIRICMLGIMIMVVILDGVVLK